MLSQTGEYALRAVAHLAASAPQPQTTKQIADVTRVPPAYLAKVIQALVRAGIAVSQRGAKGGVSLAVPPEELSILDVINAVDPIRRIHECPLGLAAHGTRLCPLHARLDRAAAMVEEAFADTT